MAQNPVLMRTLFIEILTLGPAGLAARRRVTAQIAQFMLDVVGRDSHGPLAPQLAMGVVGAINELVLDAIEQDRVARLHELVAPASALVRLVMARP